MDTKTKENSYLIDWLSFTIQTDIHGVGKKAVREFLEQMNLDTLLKMKQDDKVIIDHYHFKTISMFIIMK